MFNICNFEANIISVERIKKFENDFKKDKLQDNKSEKTANLLDSWPKKGSIEISNLNVEYVDDDKEKRTPALKGINCKIGPGKKVKLPCYKIINIFFC